MTSLNTQTFRYHLVITCKFQIDIGAAYGPDSCFCPECPKMFENSWRVVKHMIDEHQGHKQFECRICGVFVAGRSGLRSHINTQHVLPNQFGCVRC